MKWSLTFLRTLVILLSRPESIMLFKLPIMLLSISPKIYLLCSIMPNYAPLIVKNYLCLVLRLHIIIVICFLSEYLINYRANYLICDFNAISVTALLE